MFTGPRLTRAPVKATLIAGSKRSVRAAYVGDFLRASQQFLVPLEPYIKDIPAAHAPLVPPAMSDVDGRFQVAGVGRERVSELIIDGPGLASGLIVAATRPIDKPLTIPAKVPALKNQIANTWDDLSVFGERIEYAARAGRVVEGIVSDRGSGKPLAGIVVHGPWQSQLEYHATDRFLSRTDDQGRYRIEGLPATGQGEFTVDAPGDRPYLGMKAQVKIDPGPDPLFRNFPLRRAVWVSGQVLDDATGKPVQDSFIRYFAFADNPFLRQDLQAGSPPELLVDVRTDADGRFRMAAYPGRGIVSATAYGYVMGSADLEKEPRLKGIEFNERLYPPYQFSSSTAGAVVEVNAPDDAESIACDLRLRKGKSRDLLVVDPDNKPVFGVEASGLKSQIENPMTAIQVDHFQVTNLVPGESRAVVARVVSRKLMGLAMVPEAGDAPVTLCLLPWCSLTGRLVDDAGRPRTQAMEIRLECGKLPLHTVNGRGYHHPTFAVGPDGRFQIEGLVPGAGYKLQALEGGVRILGDLTLDLVLHPGESRDLGDLKIRP